MLCFRWELNRPLYRKWKHNLWESITHHLSPTQVVPRRRCRRHGGQHIGMDRWICSATLASSVSRAGWGARTHVRCGCACALVCQESWLFRSILFLVCQLWHGWGRDADIHSRAAILRGGSNYKLPQSAWYFRQALELDTHNKYLLMDNSYERAATMIIGFRCVVDAAK